MTRRRRAALLLALLGALMSAAPAAAEDVSSAELRPLLHAAAAGDPVAEGRLEGVTSIDGRPADLGRVLGADPDERVARLAELERRLSDPPGEGSDLSGRAGELAGNGQRQPPEPESDSGGSALGGLGVSAPVAIGLAVVVLLLAALLAQQAGRRRLPAASEGRLPGGGGEGGEEEPEAPGELERRADRAAREGDHATAVRLRFRAGLQRLASAHVIELRPSLTPGQVARSIPSGRLQGLTATFERVVYGRVAATEEDSSTARREWPVALREARGE